MNWPFVLGNIAVCAVAGGLAGFLGHKLKVGKIVTVGFVTVATVASAFGWRAYQMRPVDYDTTVAEILANDSDEGLDRYLRHWARSIQGHPEIRQWYDATPTFKSDEREYHSKLITQAGLRRLSDPLLVQRIEALSKMVESAEETDCAAFGRGDITEAGMNRTLSKLDEETLQRFGTVVAEAMAAELRRSPEPRRSVTADVAQSFAEVSFRIGSQQTLRLRTNLLRMNELPDDEACWTTRTLYTQAATLRGRNQDALVLALVTEE
ncbi:MULTISPECIES: hypothetical protein [unclassified Corallococcus]|uniref:hypothetical protein n=1 Tax=unclassified Corallococcus TaxID=2685029 RepID=UPI001A8D1D6D|nr:MULTISPECIES: hypothetical protein [unclassified Corallococcus]MBN9687777.1 hypothetical protein [Corallococcus sp. NCSPR001]WAS88410.1 hypothetical protein O0N60_15820 [Corallococcus sp. NCRR]